MLTSLEIAQAAVMRPIAELAAEAGIEPDELELYGRYKAKVDLSILDRLADTLELGIPCSIHAANHVDSTPNQERRIAK